MTAGDDQPKLKVDRLAQAMAAARSRSVEPVATESLGAGAGADVPADAGPVPAATKEPPPAPTGAAGTTPLILTSELMRVPPAGGPPSLVPAPVPVPEEPPVLRAPAPAILRPHTEPVPARDGLSGSVSDARSDLPPGPVPRPRFAPPFLSLSGVGIEAPPLASVSFDVPAGAVTVLLGAPGAGASELLRALIGLEPMAAGQVRLDGQDITGWQPRRIARAGVGYLSGDLGLFPALSVAENLSLGALAARLPRDRLDAVFRMFPALKPVWHRPARDLDRSGAQMLALARLMAERRRLYLIDTGGMVEGAESPPCLLAALRELKLQRATILMAAHSLRLAAAFGDTCVALAAGQAVWSGPVTVMAEDEDLQARCLGPGGAER